VWSACLCRILGRGSRAHLEPVFDRFFRIDQSRSRELGGTGLGLAIARLLAELQQGRITVESTLGHGSAFTLWLPASAAKAKSWHVTPCADVTRSASGVPQNGGEYIVGESIRMSP
jgi:hypothetical protein